MIVFHRLNGMLPCNEPISLPMPVRDRIVERRSVSDTYWSVYIHIMRVVCPNVYSPGERARIFGRLGWPD